MKKKIIYILLFSFIAFVVIVIASCLFLVKWKCAFDSFCENNINLIAQGIEQNRLFTLEYVAGEKESATSKKLTNDEYRQLAKELQFKDRVIESIVYYKDLEKMFVLLNANNEKSKLIDLLQSDRFDLLIDAAGRSILFGGDGNFGVFKYFAVDCESSKLEYAYIFIDCTKSDFENSVKKIFFSGPTKAEGGFEIDPHASRPELDFKNKYISLTEVDTGFFDSFFLKIELEHLKKQKAKIIEDFKK